MKTFQKPLSAAEEAHYIQALQEGNSDEAAAAKEILIERNLRLVAHIAKKYQNVDEDMEDLISIGTIGLIKAISSFDAGKGKLSTYASRCIDNELLMLLRYLCLNLSEQTRKGMKLICWTSWSTSRLILRSRWRCMKIPKSWLNFWEKC